MLCERVALAGLLVVGGLVSSASVARAQSMGGPGGGMGGMGGPGGSSLPPDDIRDEAGWREDGDGDDAPADPRLGLTPPGKLDPLVHVVWRGNARVRAESLYGLRLASDGSWPPRLDLRHGSADSPSTAQTFSATELRLRLEPQLRIGEWTSIHLQADARGSLGNDTLLDRGGNAEQTESAMLSQFSGDWQQGPLGMRSGRAGLAVRRAWVQSRLFGLVDVQIGRMGDHFGLGILRNDGSDAQSDFQSDVDKVRVGAELFGLRLHLARAVLADWPAASSAAFGSAASAVDYSIQDSAQVTRWEVEVESGERGLPVGLAFGGALLWTTQDVALRLENELPASDGSGGLGLLGDPACGPTCAALLPRDFSLYTAQGYVDWRSRRGRHRFGLAAEGVLRYGSIGRSDIRAAADAKTLLSGGLAAEAFWTLGARSLRLHAGGASGAGSGGFGVLDSHNFNRGGGVDGTPQATLTGFAFHRNYRVDGLLFRELVGAVANSLYARPAAAWTTERWGWRWETEASVLTAWAASSGATPGNASWLGWEPELTFGAQRGNQSAVLRGSLLMPGDGLRSPGGASADPAGRVELRWFVRF